MCAGNHDIDRNNNIRNEEIDRIRNGGELLKTTGLVSGYGEFSTLYHAVTGRFYKHFNIEETENCRIFTVDSSLLSKDNNDIGKLGVCFQELAELDKKITLDKKLNIVIMHHGIAWLMPQDAREFQHWLAEHNIDIVFCGHNHSVGLDILTEAISDLITPQNGILQFTCGAALYDRYTKPSFYVAQIDDKNKLDLKLYVYQDNSRWEVGQGLLRSFPNGVCSCTLKNINKYNEKSSTQTKSSKKENSDIYKEYDTIFDADSDIANDLKNSNFIDFYGMRGGTFLKENSKTADVLYSQKQDIICRILISYPFCDKIENRLKMVPDFSARENLEKRWKEIYEDIGRLKNNIKDLANGNIRFHEESLLFRFIIMNNCVYFGFYEKKNSSKSKMFRYDSTSKEYLCYKNYFDNIWNHAKIRYPNIIPQKYSFLQGTFDMMPSLVINLTDKCNMNCRYCPKGGENLEKVEKLCNIKQIKFLMTSYLNYCKKMSWNEKKVIRITGGEPLLNENRINEILSHAIKQGYQKIILCTNGILLKEIYLKNQKLWENAKETLLLKISLDTLKQDVFYQLTQTNNNTYLNQIVDNIKFLSEKDFKIELNLVATKDNVDEIEQVYNFACQNSLIGVKVLTINDFGKRIEPENVNAELTSLIERMRNNGYSEHDLYVHNNKGILMKRFVNNGCTLTIVDHMNTASSITPRRTYSSTCKKCDYYPKSEKVKTGLEKACATGIMSLTMRADGLLSFCRLKCDVGNTIANKSMRQINEIVNKQMKNFCECYHCDSQLS